MHKQRPGIIAKHVLPATFKLLDDGKTEMKVAVNKLVQTLYGLVGKELIDAAPPGKVSRILEAVKC